MFKKLILSIGLLLICGCSFIPFLGSSKEKIKIPKSPERTFEQIENIKKNVDVVVDISHIAYTSGIGRYSNESSVLLKSAKVLQTISGLPVNPIDWRFKEEIEELHEDILEQEELYREEREAWENKIKSLNNDKQNLVHENSSLKTALDKFKFWFWFCVIALGVICFLFPTVGIPLVRWLIGRVKKTSEIAITEAADAVKGQMGQVVSAIEEFKKEKPDEAKKLLENLQKTTDSKTRDLILQLKNK